MIVELGNPAPLNTDGRAPAVTRMTVPDHYTYVPAVDDGQTQTIGRERQVDVKTAQELAMEVALHLANPPADGITHVPDQEALISVISSWRTASAGSPSWVVVAENADFEELLSQFFRCPRGYPADLEETHYTHAGEPGVGPTVSDPEVTS